MTETTTAEIAAVAAAHNLANTSIKDAVLSQFKETEVTLIGLADKYRNVAFNVTTTKGMAEAKAARADIRDNGRLFVTKAAERIKGEVNDLKRVMSTEVDRLVAIVKPHEDAIDAQIKAEETRKAEEKAERERIEAERISGHQANLTKLAGYAAQAEGRSAADIERAIAFVNSIAIGDEWQEFKEQAERTKHSCLDALNKLLATEKMREEAMRAAQELEAQRAELAAQAAELKRQQEAILSQRVAQTHAIVFTFPAEEPPAAEENQAPPMQLPARHTEPESEPEQKDVAPTAVKRFARAIPSIETPADELMTTGDLCKKLNGTISGLTVTTEFIKSLGFSPVANSRPGTRWQKESLQSIAAAISNHILAQAAIKD